MRPETESHRPVTAQPWSESRIAWLGPAEAARQRSLLRVQGREGDERRRTDRRRTERRAERS